MSNRDSDRTPPGAPLDASLGGDLEDELPSKTQRKREMQALRDFGERIVTLPRGQRDALPLTDALRRAFEEYDRIRSREARRRHLSFVGKVLRETDLTALEAAVDRLDAASATASRELHVLEAWRTALLADDGAQTSLFDLLPDLDRQRMRQIVRAARREAERATDRRHFRELFRVLRAAVDETTLAQMPYPGKAAEAAPGPSPADGQDGATAQAGEPPAGTTAPDPDATSSDLTGDADH